MYMQNLEINEKPISPSQTYKMIVFTSIKQKQKQKNPSYSIQIFQTIFEILHTEYDYNVIDQW